MKHKIIFAMKLASSFSATSARGRPITFSSNWKTCMWVACFLWLVYSRTLWSCRCSKKVAHSVFYLFSSNWSCSLQTVSKFKNLLRVFSCDIEIVHASKTFVYRTQTTITNSLMALWRPYLNIKLPYVRRVNHNILDSGPLICVVAGSFYSRRHKKRGSSVISIVHERLQ